MNKILLTSIFIVLTSAICGQTNTSLAGPTLLFKNVKSKSTAAERKDIFLQSGLKVSKDKKQFVANIDQKLEYPFDAMVFPTDLNNDGVEELCILYGNTFTSGSTGTDVLLFIRDASGKYRKNLGGPGALPIVLPTGNRG